MTPDDVDREFAEIVANYQRCNCTNIDPHTPGGSSCR